MKYESFDDFFKKATNGRDCYPYQRRFAESERFPTLVKAPTGAGKTATILIGWLWRVMNNSKETPRRLVYCLPMRVLVEQISDEAKRILENLNLKSTIDVHIMMGGGQIQGWHLYPDRPTILVGTQDMLLSRALNRGYAASRFHWPIDFSLLNNDCLWVYDEPQLMGAAVTTSAQLAGFRSKLNTFGRCQSIWMSATLEKNWLDTIDYKDINKSSKTLILDKADFKKGTSLNLRMEAAKSLQKATSTFQNIKSLTNEILKKHEDGTQTLVIVNTVQRAKELYKQIQTEIKQRKIDVLLIHSRFRPHDRVAKVSALQRPDVPNRIVISTQVIEAGVDITCRTLFTEIAPWASLVQRFGRCNRTGREGSTKSPANVYWIDVPNNKEAPYSGEELNFSREKLMKLEGAGISPIQLEQFKQDENISLPFVHKHVLRRRDLLGLFDTTPDLTGSDIDIQRYVRSESDELDVKVFWRDLDNKDTADADPGRDELCNVPIGELREFIKSLKSTGAKGVPVAAVWDYIDCKWRACDPGSVIPGIIVRLSSKVGGYDAQVGWDKTITSKVDTIIKLGSSDDVNERHPEGIGNDQLVSTSKPLTLEQHTEHVLDEIKEILVNCLDEEGNLGIKGDMILAALWHDVGKAHFVFQDAMHEVNNSLNTDTNWAKSGSRRLVMYSRPHFRHELVSALAALQNGASFLVAYLVAAHHGKVRLAIRNIPGRSAGMVDEDNKEQLSALGVQSGDKLPAIKMLQLQMPETHLDLSPMKLGADSSWVEESTKLLIEYGPFRLGYLETLLRIADQRASMKEK